MDSVSRADNLGSRVQTIRDDCTGASVSPEENTDTAEHQELHVNLAELFLRTSFSERSKHQSTPESVIHEGRILSTLVVRVRTKHFLEEVKVASLFGNCLTVFDELVSVR